MVKKFILSLIFLFSANSAFAYNNVLIFSDEAVIKVSIKDESLANIRPFFTIMNERDTYIIEPKKNGKSEIKITLKNGKEKFLNINILSNETVIIPCKGFSFLQVDEPPEIESGQSINPQLKAPDKEVIKLDAPPTLPSLRGNN